MNHSAFLADITANPHEDTPRLVYADWLSEQDDPEARARGELIRVQQALWDTDMEVARRMALALREALILGTWRDRWAAPLQSVTPVLTNSFSRGFLERIGAGVGHMAREGESIRRLVPVREWCVLPETLGSEEEQKAACEAAFHDPWLRRVEILDLVDAPLGLVGWACLAASPHLTRLQAVRLEATALSFLAAHDAPWLRGLEILQVAGEVSRACWAEMLPRLAGLRRLNLNGSWAEAPTEGYFRGFSLPHLHFLRLDNWYSFPLRFSSPGPEDLPALRTLELRRNGGSEDVLRMLAANPLLGRVENLCLSGHKLSEQGLWDLLASPHSRSLAHLELRGGGIGVDGAQALGHIAPVSLRSLDLSNNPLADGGARALVEGEGLDHLTTLRLRNASVGPVGAAELAPYLPAGLAMLDLSWNRIGSFGLRALLSSPALPGLAALDLSYAGIDEKGAQALAGCPEAGALETLNLATNRLGDEGLCALAASPHLKKLTTLSLANNGIGEQALEALMDSPLFVRLEALDLTGNPIPPARLAFLRRRFRGILGG